MPTSSIPSILPRCLVLALSLATLGCKPATAKSPAEAQRRLRDAATSRDPAQLWKALDQDTHWAWMSVQRAWREAYDITLSNVPEGPNRDRLQSRFEPGATSENAETLFTKLLTDQDWAKVAADVARMGASATPKLDPSGNSATVESPTGPVLFRNAHNQHWGWGYSGLADRAEALNRTASIDLENLRKDAADLERAAARGAL